MGGVSLGAAALINDSDTAVGFNGSDAGVLFPDSASLSPTAAISVEAWVHPDAVPTASGSGWNLVTKWNTALLYVQGGASPRFAFALYDSGTLSYSPVVTSSSTVAAGSTYHVVGTYDGSNLRIYVNGVLRGTTARSGLVVDSSGNGTIAPGGWGTRPSPRFEGRIDEVAIYGSALTSTRIQTHYTRGTT